MKKQKMIYKTEEQTELLKVIIIAIVVVVLIAGVFVVSKVLIKEEAKDLAYEAGKVSTETAIVGTMLNQNENEYYVLAYDPSGVNASAYITYTQFYTSEMKEKALKLYYLDLSTVFNKDYYVKENSNTKASKISELKMLDGTLVKIKNKKIVEYIEGIENIAKKLKTT